MGDDQVASELVCAVLTPAGRGAVATVGVRGAAAAAAVGRRFRAASGRPLSSCAAGSVAFGSFRTAAAAEEELVLGVIGPGEIEVHCHGGTAAVAAICAALAEEGCCRVDSAEWLSRKPVDPVANAALLALAQARTERTAAVLLDQHRGALSSALHDIAGDLQRGSASAARAAIQALLARGEFGLRLTQPWRVVLAGLPNAGKSSLLNALVGFERAIVLEQPGTTRDVVTASAAIEGWPIELADTAGLRPATDEVEIEGVQRARDEIARADAVLLVSDVTKSWDTNLYVDLFQNARRLLVVHNKRDLVNSLDDARPHGVMVSAKTGAGIDDLWSAVSQLLVPWSPPAGAAVPFTSAQITALKNAAAALDRGSHEQARRELHVCALA